MRKRIAQLFGWLAKSFEEKKPMNIIQPEKDSIYPIVQPKVELFPPVETEFVNEEQPPKDKTTEKKFKKKSSTDVMKFDPRDIIEVMEVPFLSLSKNRTKSINYKSKDGKTKVKISAHREHYVASIYDWDIIQLIAGKMQEMINSGSDIPPRTLIIERHALIKSLHKHDVRKTAKEIEAALFRLNSTIIETTIRNEDYRYKGGFGFLDSWGYTERKDIKEFEITLSQWLYDGICKKGSLLKVSQEYFDITSGLKKFLYRTGRKHVGNNDQWEFFIEKLYEKSGSEQVFRFFKRDLKKAVLDNDIPEYFLEWRNDGGKTSIRFSNKRKELTKILAQ